MPAAFMLAACLLFLYMHAHQDGTCSPACMFQSSLTSSFVCILYIEEEKRLI
jgi:hypothetical protein